MSTIAQIPIDFSLLNQANHAAALFTLGQPANGQSLEATIWNRTSAALRIPQSTGTPTADDFHFSFHLPPGLLAQSGFGLRVPDGWQASATSVDADGFTRIYVLRTGEAFDLPTEDDGSPLQFQLEGIHLDSELAWHHTSIVLQSQGIMEEEEALPTSFRRLPIRILHTFATDLSELDSAQSVPALRDAMIQLRDIAVPPLQAQIVEDLNFLTDVNLQTVQLEILANPAFFTATSVNTVGVNSTDTTITIAALTQTAGEDISAELLAGEDDWSLQNNGDAIVLSPSSDQTVIDESHLIKLSVTLRVEPLQLRHLWIECDGFKKRR